MDLKTEQGFVAVVDVIYSNQPFELSEIHRAQEI